MRIFEKAVGGRYLVWQFLQQPRKMGENRKNKKEHIARLGRAVQLGRGAACGSGVLSETIS